MESCRSGFIYSPGGLLSSVILDGRLGAVKARLICLVRRQQWHNGWDEERHLTVWTCKRCGKTRVPADEMGDPRMMAPGGGGGGIAA
jgi:hypothetical protein